MIGTLLRSSWINLRRDRVAQALTFALPIIFFSIFALVFGNQRNPSQRIRVAIADEDHSEYSARLIGALKSDGALRVQLTTGDGSENVRLGPAGAPQPKQDTGAPLTRQAAEKLIKDGALSVAIVIPKGLGAAPRLWGGDNGATRPKVDILADVSDPIAPQMVMGLLQKASFTAMPELMATEGIGLFEKYSGPLTPEQRKSFDSWVGEIKNGTPSNGSNASRASALPIGLDTQIVNVMQPGTGNTATISFYAAGVGVMFLLFSCSAAGGALLEQEEDGTLGRLIGSRAGMGGVLAGKWLFYTLMGIAQLTLMFTWGAVVFKLPLASHLPGFFVMTACTAMAAGAFGLVLATLSRSRQQLSGISTILILTMSALGGSMFPRFLMSPTMQKIGLVTFNAWALDGYIAVFWREAPVVDLWPQVLVLLSLTVVFLSGARLFARRWETL